MKAHPVIRLH